MTIQKELALVGMIMYIFIFTTTIGLGLYILLTGTHLSKFAGIYIMVVGSLAIPGIIFYYQDYKYYKNGNRKTIR